MWTGSLYSNYFALSPSFVSKARFQLDPMGPHDQIMETRFRES